MILLKNAKVYSPAYLGIKDVLVEGSKIIDIQDEINLDNPYTKVYDLEGKVLTPGLIDSHVHITGGGGEAGPSSRTPESNLTDFTTNGVTTVLGLLGTDSITKSLENLYAKAKALNEEGISCYMLTGSYTYPSPTVTGSVEKDIYMMDVCIGAKIAASDHRSSNPSSDELIRLGTQARRGGLISSKAGLVTVHMGSGKAGLDPILRAVQDSDIPIKTFVPTHVNLREPGLLDECVEFAKLGGTFDFTTATSKEESKVQAQSLIDLLDRGVDPSNITVSSDAFGSMPRFDEEGNTIGLTYSTSKNLLVMIRDLVGAGLDLSTALVFFTQNPARVMGLDGFKGKIQPGYDADLLVLDEDLCISHVFAKGRAAIEDRQVVLKGKFEI